MEKSYEAFRGWMPEIPYLNLVGMEKEIKAGDLIDESFVRELDQQGFYRTLYKKECVAG